jgi:hypothetical protein
MAMPKRQISRRPIPISEAIWHFAPKRLKDEFDRAQSSPRRSSGVPEPPKDRAEAIRLALEASKELFNALRADPFSEMKKHLLDRICSGKLEAIGVMIKPELGRQPQKIPAFIFGHSPKIQWDKNTIENFEQRFEGVEVQRPSGEKEPDKKAAVPVKKAGRPRVDGQIREVIRELRKEGELRGKSKRWKVRAIQDRAQIRYPNLFPTKTQPSQTKIREMLKLEGE